MGPLNLDLLVENNVLKMDSLDQTYNTWLTVKKGFELYIEKDLCWCQFGQVNDANRPHGICRIIKENGVIREG